MNRADRRKSWTRRAHGLLRVASLLLTGAALCAWLALDALHARAHELTSEAGARMLAYGQAHARQGTQTLMLNGLALRLHAGTSRDAPGRVLDVIDERCRARDGQLSLQLQERARAKLPPRIAALAFDPVLRLADERGGFLGCLDLGAQRLDPSELLARARRFARTADVAEIGALRFVWARREARATRYVAVWSDGPLPLAHAFPSSGDAPGPDAPGLPRPEHGRRILSAWQVGAAPLLVSYESNSPVQRALPAYAATLRANGQHVTLGAPQRDGTHWLIARRGAASSAVIAAPRAGGSLLTLTPLQ